MRKRTFAKNVTALLLTVCMISTMVTPALAEVTVTEDTLPSSYDARDYGYITEKKAQYGGTCWAFAATAAAEASLVKSGLADNTIDLSELHTAYYTYVGACNDPLGNITEDVGAFSPTLEILLNGGYAYFAGYQWAKWSGPVAEETMPYSNEEYRERKPIEPAEDLSAESMFHIKEMVCADSVIRADGITYEDGTDEIKELILEYGAVAAGYYVGRSSYTNLYDYPEVTYHLPGAMTSSHAATIVGWDDSYPKEHFNVQPKRDGAWLVKNHDGGEGVNKNRYMWISYETNIFSPTAFLFEPAELLENNYQYDGTSYLDVDWTCISGKKKADASKAMNVFEAKRSKDTLEKLEAVMIWEREECPCKITVYVNPVMEDGQMISYEYMSTPLEYAVDHGGLYKVDLWEDIYLNDGDTFGIEVEGQIGEKDIYDADGELIYTCSGYPITSQRGYGKASPAGIYAYETAHPGESYVGYTDNETGKFSYEDLSVYGSAAGNLRIKGFTNSTDIPLAGDVSIDKSDVTLKTGENTTIHGEVEVPDGALDGISYTSSNPDVAKVDENGKVTAVAPGTATITVAATYGADRKTCEVTVYPKSIAAEKSISMNQSENYSLNPAVDGVKIDLESNYMEETEPYVTLAFTSSNTEVAEVNEIGYIHAVAPGTATITIATTDGSNLKTTCTVTVLSGEEIDVTPEPKPEPTPTPEPDPEPPLKQDKDNNSNVNDKRNDSNKDTGNDKTDSEDVRVGDTFTSGSLKYDITSLGKRSSSGTVRVTGVKSKNSKSITVPATVKYKDKTYKVDFIGTKAFYGCKKLQSVSIGKNVTGIASKAFYNCKKLKTINVTSKKISSVGKNAFKGIKSDAKITVPKSKYKTYKKSFKKAGVGSKVTWKKK